MANRYSENKINRQKNCYCCCTWNWYWYLNPEYWCVFWYLPCLKSPLFCTLYTNLSHLTNNLFVYVLFCVFPVCYDVRLSHLLTYLLYSWHLRSSAEALIISDGWSREKRPKILACVSRIGLSRLSRSSKTVHFFEALSWSISLGTVVFSKASKWQPPSHNSSIRWQVVK